MNARNIILLVLSGLAVIIALYPQHNYSPQESIAINKK